MYSVTKTQDSSQPYVTELIADTPEDIKTLPTHYSPGSSVIVISTGSVYILNTEHQWVEL